MHRKASSYTIHRLLGQGGFGKVYQATATEADGTKQVVALKLVDPSAASEVRLAGLRDEARVASLLDDPVMARVEPPFVLQGMWAVEMEYVDGTSLFHLLKAHPRLPPRPAVEIVATVLGALSRLSAQGFIHRDLKPGNVQLTPTGVVKVLDFGNAMVRGARREREPTAQDAVIGTRGYIAPERFDNTEDPKGDVYALGVMLHHVIVGSLPGATAEGAPLPPGADDALKVAAAMRARELSDRMDAAAARDRLLDLHADMKGPNLAEWVRVVRPVPRGLPADDLVGKVLRPTAHEMPLYGERRRIKTVTPAALLQSDPVMSETGSPPRPAPAPSSRGGPIVLVLGVAAVMALVATLVCGLGLGLGVGAFL